MKKIKSVFKRDYEGTRNVYDEVVEGCEWVLDNDTRPRATLKWDGTACMVRDGQLFKRYDRKRNKKTGEIKPAPPNWEPCEDEPNEHTGHWPGWVPVGNAPADQWYRMAWAHTIAAGVPDDGTYELCGPHFNGNPHRFSNDVLIRHGLHTVNVWRTFRHIETYLESHEIEGIVFYGPNGEMAKIKRRDFGYDWPT